MKNPRPEEIFVSPLNYYTEEESERYEKSTHIKKIQTYYVLRLLELTNLKPFKRVLDLGCGTGFSTEVLNKCGFKVVGIDINPYMLRFAKKKSLCVILGDFRELEKYFKKSIFDAIISTSALQWIKERNDMKKVSEGIKYVLKDNGIVGIQFYPYSSEELNTWIRVFRKNFNVKLIIENETNPKKRDIYLILEKTKIV